MDLITLTINLEKEPKAYTEEFRKLIQSYLNMCRLPKQPPKVLRQTLDVLVKFSFVDKEAVAEAVAESVGYLKSYKLKKCILAALLSLTYKKLISPSTCIKAILDHSSDPGYFISKVKTFIDQESSEVVVKYYEIGDEKQRVFCYYFLLVLFSKYKIPVQHLICQGLFGEGKVKRLSFKYFLDLNNMKYLDESCKVYGSKLYEEIESDKEEREVKILKMRIYTLFKNRFELRPSICTLALSMIDPSKEDVKDLMNVVVDSVTEKELEGVLKKISTHFCSPFKEEDLICYGLNLLRFIYLKYDQEVVDENGMHESSMHESGSDDSMHESGSDSTHEIGSDIDTTSTPAYSKFLDDLKENILNYVECFKDSKVKSISYSYRSIVNVLKKKKNTGRGIDFILRRLTKEERLELHRKNKESNKAYQDMYKAEKKEMRKKKSKRKFKLSKKRMKINAGKRNK